MGRGYEILTGRVANPGAGGAALTPNTGNSFTVRSFADPAAAWLEQVWAKGATAGFIQVASPRLHDNVQGIRLPNEPAIARAALPSYAAQLLYPQDDLVVSVAGGAAETDIGAVAVYYEDIGGIDARLAQWNQVAPLIKSLLTVRVNIAAAGTLGDWSAGDRLDLTTALLKANVDYALLGYCVTNEVGAIGVAGADTGNVRVGGPGSQEYVETRDWFVRQSVETGLPHIPIINAANAGATLCYQVDNAAGAANLTYFNFAELSAAP